jgi:dolichol-phosphate mannosyltransferase
VTFVIPVFNEIANIGRCLDDLAASANTLGLTDATVIVVDDGSTDGTAAAAEDLGVDLQVVVLRHEVNRGPGHAFGTAFEHLAGSLGKDDFIVTMEGDNTSRIDVLPRMLRRLGEGDDVVLASPYMYGGGILHTRPTRIFMSHVANTIVKEVLGVHGLLTVSSFFRVYRVEALARLQAAYGNRVIERAGFESMVEVIMKMTYLGFAISEVPMILDTSLRAGSSKLRVGRTATGYLALAGQKRRWQAQARAYDQALGQSRRGAVAGAT